MNLEAVFLLSVYVLTAAAGAMLAFGEETFFPAGVTIPLALVALLFCERKRQIFIGPWVSNLLGLVALGLGIYESMGGRPDSRLLAGAHFLVYITWIVLFQAKVLRQYWWLCALSLLQVAVGSVLTLALGWYGLWLLGYLLLALWTLSVFTLYQGAFEFGALPGRRALDPERNATGGAQSPLANDRLERLPPFAGRFADDRSAVRHSIQQDFPGRWIFPRFVIGVMSLAVAGLTLGLGLFLLVPRVWLGGGATRESDSFGGGNVTGFSTEVRLGALGEILESTDRVMQVRFFNSATNERISLERFAARLGLLDPLFRGSVLDAYENGHWMCRDQRNQATIRGRQEPSDPVRQEYTLDISTSGVLFAMLPFRTARLEEKLRGRQELQMDSETKVLTTQRADGREPLRYFVYSNLPADGESGDGRIRASDLPGAPLARTRAFSRHFDRYLALPDDQRLERLAARARELVDPERLIGNEQSSTAKRMVQTLEAHLRDSGEYAYSLSMAIDDPSIDPVEDFLFNRKRGHCEYFASALALMLRAVQVPSRLVTGFKGADFKASEDCYEVQQRHAHAWVEAYVDNEWIVLDPTPAARNDVVRDVVTRTGFFKKAANSISSLWSSYVVSLSLNRQQEALYDPLQGTVSSGFSSVRSILGGIAAAIHWAREVLASPDELFSRRGALLFAGVFGAVVCCSALFRRLRNRSRARGARRGRDGWLVRAARSLLRRLRGTPPDPARVIVAFYEEFLRLVETAGLSRRRNQTQREFAREIERSLAGRLGPADLQRFPSELAELFYRVRFGSEVLPAADEQQIESRLNRLRESLTNGRR